MPLQLTQPDDENKTPVEMTSLTGKQLPPESVRPFRRRPGLRYIWGLCLLASVLPLVQGHLYFLPFLHEARVYEGAPAGQYVMTVVARDDDGDPHITYSLLKGGDMFEIENGTGRLSTRREVLKNPGDEYYILLVAVSADETQSVPLTVKVTQANRHAPAFQKPTYAAEISILEPVNSTILTVKAVDSDVEKYNAEVFYFITQQWTNFTGKLSTITESSLLLDGMQLAEGPGQNAGYLSIDKRSGAVALRQALPKEGGTLRAKVLAKDGGSPTRLNQTLVEVEVKTIPSPRNVTVNNATATNVQMCWLPPQGGADIAGYLVWYSTVNVSSYANEHILNVTMEDPKPQHCIYLTSLKAATNYQASIAGWNNEETGIRSSPMQFNTSVARCFPENVCGNGTCNPRPSPGGSNVLQYDCSCYEGFYGPHCQHFNPCISSPCKNLGTCTNTSDGVYVCQCVPGFSGRECSEFDPCTSKKVIDCQNGGTCLSNGSHEYKCLCPKGYFGPMCQWFDPCSVTPAPCLNGATCRNETNEEYTCICQPGFIGKYCDIDIDECESAPCQNGGTCRQSVALYECMCPFHFQGTSCEEPVECLSESVKVLGREVLFDAANMGGNVSKPCPYGPEGAQVMRACIAVVDSIQWGQPDARACQERGLQMAGRMTGQLQSMTSDPSTLGPEDVKNITGEIEKILGYAIQSPKIGREMITIISNIMEANDTAFVSEDVNTSSNRLSNVITRFISEVKVDQELSIEATNLMVRVIVANATELGLKSSPGLDSSKNSGMRLFGIAQRTATPRRGNVSLEVSIPELTVSNTALRLAAQKPGSRARVHFVAHSNAKIFREPPGSNALDRHTPSNRPVFMISLANTTVANVSSGISFTMKKPLYGKWICVFWNNSEDGPGHWSQNGLTAEQDEDNVTCTSDHMTAFSILLDPEPDEPMDEKTSKTLSIISYIGSGLSVLGLLLTILTYSLFRSLNRDKHGKILLNLCVAMLLLNVSFLAGAFRSEAMTDDIVSESDGNFSTKDLTAAKDYEVQEDELCTAVAVFSHYFLLATMVWMSVEAANMYQLLVYVFATAETRFLLKRCLIGWGAPLIIVGITAAVDISYYNYDNETCLLSARNPYVYYFTLFGPCCLLLLVNTVVFGLVTRILFQPRQTMRLEEKGSKKKSSFDTVTFAQVRGAFTVMVLLGVAWVFGALAVGPVRVVFQYIFCIINSLQGFLVFVVRCLQYPEARAAWMQLFHTGTLKKYRGSKMTTTSNSNSHAKPGGNGGSSSGAHSTTVYSTHTRSTFDGNGNGMHPITGTVFTRNVPGVTASGALSWSKPSIAGLGSPTWVYGGTAEKRDKNPPVLHDDTKEGRDTCWEYHNINRPHPVELRGPWVPETPPMRLSVVGAYDLPFIEDEAEPVTQEDKEEEEADVSVEIRVKRRNRANKQPVTKTESHSDQGYSTGEHSPAKKRNSSSSPEEMLELQEGPFHNSA